MRDDLRLVTYNPDGSRTDVFVRPPDDDLLMILRMPIRQPARVQLLDGTRLSMDWDVLLTLAMPPEQRTIPQ
jgi:hypothetical protein